MKENKFQLKLIREIKTLFPGCVILKNDSGYIQGIPDLLILYKSFWAALECKANFKSTRQPNQEHYIKELDKLSYARFVYPENMEEVLYELQQAYAFRRGARVSER